MFFSFKAALNQACPNIYILIVKITEPIRWISYMAYTRAPSCLYPVYLKTLFLKKRIEQTDITDIAAKLKNKKFTQTWFEREMPYWRFLLKHYQWLNNRNINVLEIGSWEGFSTSFIAQEFSVNQLHCVDTWEGGDEHASEAGFNLLSVEENFDSNLFEYKKSIVKNKTDSYNFFSTNKTKFDLAYIDGSHFSQDVLIDAIKSFESLNVGGIMIFDDYFWKYYHIIRYDPAFGINSFLNMIKGHYKPILLHRQLFIKKTKNIERT